MTQKQLMKAIKKYHNSSQCVEDFRELALAIGLAFRQGTGLSGTEIDNAISEAYGAESLLEEKHTEAVDEAESILNSIIEGNTYV